MSGRSIVVVSAGINEPSATRMLGDLLAAATSRALEEQGIDSAAEVVELRDHARALANRMISGVGSPALDEAIDAVLAADGVIVVTPVFSASYSGLFKSFFDILEPEALKGKPVLIAATAGTPRHSLVLDHALRPLFSYLGAIVVPTGVFAATEDWGAGSDQALSKRAGRAGAELAELAAANRSQPDRFDDVPSFATLLAGD